MSAQRPRAAARRVVAAGSCLLLGTLLASPPALANPDAALVLRNTYASLTEDCDLDCCYEVAGAYTRNFLDTIHSAAVSALEAAPDADSKIRSDFGGSIESLDELRRTSGRRVFASMLREQVRSGWTFTVIDIRGSTQIAPGRVQFFVMKSGVRGRPSVREEDVFRMALEEGVWRIDL